MMPGDLSHPAIFLRNKFRASAADAASRWCEIDADSIPNPRRGIFAGEVPGATGPHVTMPKITTRAPGRQAAPAKQRQRREAIARVAQPPCVKPAAIAVNPAFRKCAGRYGAFILTSVDEASSRTSPATPQSKVLSWPASELSNYLRCHIYNRLSYLCGACVLPAFAGTFEPRRRIIGPPADLVGIVDRAQNVASCLMDEIRAGHMSILCLPFW